MKSMLDCSNAQAKQRRKGVVRCGFTVSGHVFLLSKRYRVPKPGRKNVLYTHTETRMSSTKSLSAQLFT